MDSKGTIFVNSICPILFLGTAAALQLGCSTVYLKNSLNFSLVILFFFVTTGIYLLNRIVDEERQVQQPEEMAILQRYY